MVIPSEISRLIKSLGRLAIGRLLCLLKKFIESIVPLP
jgi:hypothetical protein